jgi:DNA-binding NarL/FixJ family response regulator
MAVEHNVALRDGLLALLSDQPDMVVVSTPSDAHDALLEVQSSEPDVTVIDVDLPGSLDLMLRLRADHPGVKIIPLVNYEWDQIVPAAVAASGSVCIPKDHISRRLLAYIRGGDD